MRETLLAFLALSIATTMSLGIMSASIQNSVKQVNREFEVYASAVAAHIMDYAGSRSFDQRTTPDAWLNQGAVPSVDGRPDSTQFTMADSFGMTPACNLFEPFNNVVICDDVSDLHSDTLWQSYQYPVEIVGTDTTFVPFEVNVKVSYVDAASPDAVLSAAYRTPVKKVTVEVRSVQHTQENIPGGAVKIERLITFDQDMAQEQSLTAVEVCFDGVTRHVSSMLVPVYERLGGVTGGCVE